MGMPITVEIVDEVGPAFFDEIYGYLAEVEQRFSPYMATSEISRFNRGLIDSSDFSGDMREVLELAVRTKRETGGYFDIRCDDGTLDPCGIVKGWAILNAAKRLAAAGIENFLVDAGGDIQTGGTSPDGSAWIVGIRYPFNDLETIKAIRPDGYGIATSGTYARGQHIHNPHARGREITDIVSLTVIGPDVLEADRFATAAFAMGASGIYLIEETPGLEGYVVAANGLATSTTGFGAYVIS
jgi:thiamine biosynthesis lipoprotein